MVSLPQEGIFKMPDIYAMFNTRSDFWHCNDKCNNSHSSGMLEHYLKSHNWVALCQCHFVQCKVIKVMYGWDFDEVVVCTLCEKRTSVSLSLSLPLKHTHKRLPA